MNGQKEREKRLKKYLENLRKEKETEKLAFEVLEKGYERLTSYEKKKERTAIHKMKSV
jgi:hypothetical protein